jgi:hypothetical protein
VIKVKNGASIDNCRAPILLALIKIDPLYDALGLDCVVTSGSEKYKHSAHRSAHYRGDAIDLRSRELAEPEEMQEAIQEKLGSDYVVLYETNHFHVHWSPVYKES